MLSYLVAILTFVFIYAILALGLNVQWGYAGLVNLGHVGFFAVGAYTSALLAKLGAPFPWSLTAAVCLASVFGILVALTTLRLREDFLAIVTLGFGEIIRLILENWNDFSFGPSGIANIPRPSSLWASAKLSGSSF